MGKTLAVTIMLKVVVCRLKYNWQWVSNGRDPQKLIASPVHLH